MELVHQLNPYIWTSSINQILFDLTSSNSVVAGKRKFSEKMSPNRIIACAVLQNERISPSRETKICDENYDVQVPTS